MSSPSPRLLTAAMALMILIWGTTWSAIRVGLTGIPPLSGVAVRFLLAGLALAVVARIMGAPWWAGPGTWVRWLAHGLLCFCISYGVTYWAEQWVPSGLTSVLFATYSLWVVILAQFLLPEEKLRPRVALGTLTGFLGVAVIFSEDFARLGEGDVLFPALVLLIAPLSAALDSVLVKRFGGGHHPVTLNAAGMLVTAPLMAAVAWATESDRAWNLAPAPVLATIYLALCGSALAFSLYFWALRHTTATRLSTIAYAIPVVAVTIGSLAFGEPITARLILGGVGVIAGVAITSAASRRG